MPGACHVGRQASRCEPSEDLHRPAVSGASPVACEPRGPHQPGIVRWRKVLRSKALLALLGNLLILTAAAASDALAAGTWSPTGSMTVFRDGYTATLLTDGRVLVAGGCGAEDLGNCLTVLASAELYNPTAGTWSATGSMVVGRFGHTATRLLDGRVLVANGFDVNRGRLTSAELYDPTTGAWSATGSTSACCFATATLLLDGRVLVVGSGSNSTRAELYDPTTGTWSVTGSSSVGRFGNLATRLRDGRVL